MAKVIIVSRTFPGYHPNAGKPTGFVEKIWQCLGISGLPVDNRLKDELNRYLRVRYKPKGHTVRGGKRWNVGDKASIRVWSGIPYNSNQVAICDDVEITGVWNITMNLTKGLVKVNGGKWVTGFDKLVKLVADNDGLDECDFFNWFSCAPKSKCKVVKNNYIFSGQIICWDKNIKY